MTKSETAEASRVIRLAYSVDADDAFMFHALATGRVDARGLVFEHHRTDTAALNGIAAAEGADVVAISTGAYPQVADKYLLLPHGASVGRGFGPVVVAREPMRLSDLAQKRVGIPGLSTTAWLVLRLMQPGIVPVVIPINPFERIFSALETREIDAALLIHEGRLLFPSRGLVEVAELGQWWQEETKLPLPLGVNVIRKGLGQHLVKEVSAVLSDAIGYALSHRQDVIAAIAAADTRSEEGLKETALLDRYLGMYANEDTREMAPDVRQGVEALFARAKAAGLIDARVAIGWAP